MQMKIGQYRERITQILCTVFTMISTAYSNINRARKYKRRPTIYPVSHNMWLLYYKNPLFCCNKNKNRMELCKNI
jgi:hypothetical protein